MDATELVPLTRPARVALGLLPLVVAGSVLGGCSGADEPAAAPASSLTARASTPTVSTPPTTSPPVAATTPGPATAPPTASVPTVTEVFRATRTAALAAQSGHATGSMTRDGKRLRVDVEGTANGANQKVFITTPDGGTAEVLTVGDDYWVGGDEAYWVNATGDAKVAASMVGRYAPITESDATELGSFSLRSILTVIFSAPEVALLESDTGTARQAQVGGRAAYVLGRAGGPRLWVAADGSGELLRAVGPAKEQSDLTFSEWDRARPFTRPSPASVLES